MSSALSGVLNLVTGTRLSHVSSTFRQGDFQTLLTRLAEGLVRAQSIGACGPAQLTLGTGVRHALMPG